MSWSNEAACKGADWRLFFSFDPAATEQALSFCDVCPVRRECLADAKILGDHRYGVRGGLTPADHGYGSDGRIDTNKRRVVLRKAKREGVAA